VNTKVILAASALLMGVLGIAGSFLPEELLSAVGVAPSRTLVIVAQLHAALLFGFAMVNWMARGSLIGGIYNRPVAVGNVGHFVIGALALLKATIGGGQVVALYALTGFYTLFAVAFAFVLFRSPVSAPPSS
jgi:hypothetical protein